MKISAITGAVLISLFIILLGALISGGGDGWNTAFKYSFWALFLYPLAVASWVTRNKMGFIPAIAVLVIGVGIDIGLVTDTLDEGLRYVEKVIVLAIFWIVLWIPWHFFAIATVIYAIKQAAKK